MLFMFRNVISINVITNVYTLLTHINYIVKMKLCRLNVFVIVLSLTSVSTFANDEENCWEAAGFKYGIDPWILYSIANVESSLDPNAVNINNDGTMDHGLMQINDFWLPKLKGFGIGRKDLYDSCTSIYVGAWILNDLIVTYGFKWISIGYYNAGTAKNEKTKRKREQYSALVYRHYQRLRMLDHETTE